MSSKGILKLEGCRRQQPKEMGGTEGWGPLLGSSRASSELVCESAEF